MSTPFIAQLLLASWNFVPKGYASCNGALLPINQNQALFSLLGTTFGGNGIQTFGLPNLQGRTPIGFGGQVQLGQSGGEDFHTLVSSEVPTHTHSLQGSGAGPGSASPASNVFATLTSSPQLYAGATTRVQTNSGSISNVGGSQPHENRQPFLVMNWLIALTGIFPSRN